MLLFAANTMRWVQEVSGEREASEVCTSWLRGLHRVPRTQRGVQKKKAHSLLGAEKEGSRPAPISLLCIYGAPTVYKALSKSLQRS